MSIGFNTFSICFYAMAKQQSNSFEICWCTTVRVQLYILKLSFVYVFQGLAALVCFISIVREASSNPHCQYTCLTICQDQVTEQVSEEQVIGEWRREGLQLCGALCPTLSEHEKLEECKDTCRFLCRDRWEGYRQWCCGGRSSMRANLNHSTRLNSTSWSSVRAFKDEGLHAALTWRGDSFLHAQFTYLRLARLCFDLKTGLVSLNISSHFTLALSCCSARLQCVSRQRKHFVTNPTNVAVLSYRLHLHLPHRLL